MSKNETRLSALRGATLNGTLQWKGFLNNTTWETMVKGTKVTLKRNLGGIIVYVNVGGVDVSYATSFDERPNSYGRNLLDAVRSQQTVEGVLKALDEVLEVSVAGESR